MQELLDGELLKMLRAVMPVLLVVVLMLSAVEGYFIKQNADTVSALQTQNQVLTQQQAQSAAQFQIYTRTLTAELDYMCLVLRAINAHDANEPVPPAVSVCEVIAP